MKNNNEFRLIEFENHSSITGETTHSAHSLLPDSALVTVSCLKRADGWVPTSLRWMPVYWQGSMPHTPTERSFDINCHRCGGKTERRREARELSSHSPSHAWARVSVSVRHVVFATTDYAKTRWGWDLKQRNYNSSHLLLNTADSTIIIQSCRVIKHTHWIYSSPPPLTPRSLYQTTCRLMAARAGVDAVPGTPLITQLLFYSAATPAEPNGISAELLQEWRFKVMIHDIFK